MQKLLVQLYGLEVSKRRLRQIFADLIDAGMIKIVTGRARWDMPLYSQDTKLIQMQHAGDVFKVRKWKHRVERGQQAPAHKGKAL